MTLLGSTQSEFSIFRGGQGRAETEGELRDSVAEGPSLHCSRAMGIQY